MIALFFGLSAAVPPSVGLGPELFLRRSSADHTALAGLGAYGFVPLSGAAGLGVEVEAAYDYNPATVATSTSVPVRFAVHADGVVQRRGAALVLGVGPGLAVTSTRHLGDDQSWTALVVQPVLHVRGSITGSMGERLVARAHVGTYAGLTGMDWTSGVSLGFALGADR